MALPVVTPPAGACDTHAVPLLVSTLPEVPGAVTPVPPEAAARAGKIKAGDRIVVNGVSGTWSDK